MSTKPEDLDFLERRAEQELEAAQKASHPAAVRSHYQLASLYLDALESAGVSGDSRVLRAPLPNVGYGWKTYVADT